MQHDEQLGAAGDRRSQTYDDIENCSVVELDASESVAGGDPPKNPARTRRASEDFAELEVTIEKDVPVPPRGRPKPPWMVKLFDEMKPGDSTLLPEKAAKRFQMDAEKAGWITTTRRTSVEGKLRLWRMADVVIEGEEELREGSEKFMKAAKRIKGMQLPSPRRHGNKQWGDKGGSKRKLADID